MSKLLSTVCGHMIPEYDDGKIFGCPECGRRQYIVIEEVVPLGLGVTLTKHVEIEVVSQSDLPRHQIDERMSEHRKNVGRKRKRV